ncbi:hypothetical protein AKJ55_01470 [candidate division MSBL1 archaeon SCGC-AAA382M17]|uniref:LamG-like jellyroll fold domain-containing protein n=1 Tax=candidate division MSBL1 archaeon SCGC-AAA382M17 TaxID=1698284 RepID=A0ABR5TJC1_9EURY|nr:hypothetical protein AKJ55_01470 [candidate division MSBL1 archaeon SCGC-AAA382M17]
MYINGIEESSEDAAGSIETSALDLVIGEEFNGTIDELRIYNRALSEGEIERIYERTKSSSFDSETIESGTWQSLIWNSGGSSKQQINSFETTCSIGSDEEVLVRIGIDTDDDGTIDEWSHSAGNGVSLSDGSNSLGSSNFGLSSGYNYQVEYQLSVTDSDTTHSPSVQDYTLQVK